MPIKLYLHKQVLCWIWSIDHSLWTNLGKWFSFLFSFFFTETHSKKYIKPSTDTRTHREVSFTKPNLPFLQGMHSATIFSRLLFHLVFLNVNPIHSGDSSPADQKHYCLLKCRFPQPANYNSSPRISKCWPRHLQVFFKRSPTDSCAHQAYKAPVWSIRWNSTQSKIKIKPGCLL